MTTYTNIFDGETVSPAYPNSRDITLTGNVQLEWPATLLNTANIATAVMFVNSNNNANQIALPNATLVSKGQIVLFNNIGASNFIVTDFAGTQLFAAVTPGQQYFVILRSNATSAGTWGNILIGSGTSGASAAALAGDGLIAISNLLNLNTPISLISTNTNILSSDRAEFFVWTGGAGTITLPNPADADITDGYLVSINNQTTTAGQVNVVVDGGATIDGLLTFPLFAGNSATFVTDAISYYTVGNGRNVTTNITVLNLTVPTGATTITLTAAQAANQIQIYSGVLTANVKIVMPTSAAIYNVWNNTTGAFTLSVGSSGANTYVVPQGTRQIFWHNGVSELYDSVDSVSNNLTVIGTVNAANATITNTVQAPLINAGSSGAVGTVNIFPATAARGQLSLTTSNNTGNTTTSVNAAAQSGARTYTIPDSGVSASFVMTEGAQSINGIKTFATGQIVSGILNIGQSGTAGTATIFPATVNTGSLTITASDNSGNTVTNINTALQSGARTYTVPDAGASASFIMSEGTQTINGAKSFGSTVSSGGSFAATAIGGGLQVKTGSNSRIGTGTMTLGTLTVANTSVTANTKVFYCMTVPGAVIGNITVAVVDGVNFSLISSNAGEDSTFNWMLVESIP